MSTKKERAQEYETLKGFIDKYHLDYTLSYEIPTKDQKSNHKECVGIYVENNDEFFDITRKLCDYYVSLVTKFPLVKYQDDFLYFPEIQLIEYTIRDKVNDVRSELSDDPDIINSEIIRYIDSAKNTGLFNGREHRVEELIAFCQGVQYQSKNMKILAVYNKYTNLISVFKEWYNEIIYQIGD